MFALPSIWNMVASTIVFTLAAWYFRRLLEEQGVPKSITRGLLVFVLAYTASWASGEAVDWVQLKFEYTSKPELASTPNVNALMQQLDQLKQK